MTDQARTLVESLNAAIQLIRAMAEKPAPGYSDVEHKFMLDHPSLYVVATICEEAAAAILAAEQREQDLREALTEALNEWEYASQYKSEHLAKKHGDAERIAELRAALAVSSEPFATREPEHEDGCPAIADDESDYEYLADAGGCVCRVREWRKQHAHDATREQP